MTRISDERLAHLYDLLGLGHGPSWMRDARHALAELILWREWCTTFQQQLEADLERQTHEEIENRSST